MKQKLAQLFTKKNKIILLILAVLIILLVLISNSKPKVLTDAKIISNMSTLTALPDINTDKPQIFRIDVKGQQQPFFKDAKEGDVAVLFLVAQKAYIYSPSDNRIVNQGPIENTQEKPKSVPVKAVEATSTEAKRATSTTR